MFQLTESLAHCVPADFAIRKSIAAEVVEKFPYLRNSALQLSFQPGTIFAYWHEECQRFIYTWDFKKREFPTLFSDGPVRYRFRIQAENITRTESEPTKTYLQRV